MNITSKGEKTQTWVWEASAAYGLATIMEAVVWAGFHVHSISLLPTPWPPSFAISESLAPEESG